MALSIDDLEAMRATSDESLPDTCELVRDTLTRDGGGGHVATPGAPVAVACRVAPMRLTRSSAQAETIEVERVVEQSLWIVTMPHGTEITPEHRIRHVEGDRVLEVVEVLSPRSYSIQSRASCKLVNSGEG